MSSAPPHSKAPLYWLAFGTFAVGTEGFIIAPLLPSIASDLSVSVATAECDRLRKVPSVSE
jgi:predicted MFS family arabinose efflux permease